MGMLLHIIILTHHQNQMGKNNSIKGLDLTHPWIITLVLHVLEMACIFAVYHLPYLVLTQNNKKASLLNEMMCNKPWEASPINCIFTSICCL